VSVTDLNGAVAYGSAVGIVVNPRPAIASLSASPSGALAGQRLTLSAVTTGGTPNDTYAWSGLPDGCAAANALVVVCDPSVAGTFNVSFRVTDSVGVQANATVLVSVGAAFLGLPELEAYAVVGAIAAGAVLAVLIVVVTLRRRARTPAEPPR
jgi:hypothetical protein